MHLGCFVGGSYGFFVSRLNGVQGGVEWDDCDFSPIIMVKWMYMKGNDPIGDTTIFSRNHDYGRKGRV